MKTLAIWLCLAISIVGASAQASAGEASAALDVAFGPQVIVPYGVPEGFRSTHPGLAFSARVIVDPKSFRDEIETLSWPWSMLATKAKVVRWNPIPWLPDSVVFSPGFGAGSAVGMSWRVFSTHLTLAENPRISLSGGARLTWMSFFGGGQMATHFFRPGLDLGIDFELPVSDRWFLALGYASRVYIPQGWGETPLSLGDPGERLWHMGQFYLQAHRRKPWTIRW